MCSQDPRWCENLTTQVFITETANYGLLGRLCCEMLAQREACFCYKTFCFLLQCRQCGVSFLSPPEAWEGLSDLFPNEVCGKGLQRSDWPGLREAGLMSSPGDEGCLAIFLMMGCCIGYSPHHQMCDRSTQREEPHSLSCGS